MRAVRAAAAVAVGCLVAAGCSSGDDPAQPEAGGASADPVACEDIDRTFVGRERPLPGAHWQLDVFAIAEQGQSPVDADSCVTVRDDATGARLESAAISAATDERQLAIVVDPGRTAAERDRAAAHVSALLDTLPDADVALYRWGPSDDPLAVSVAHLDPATPWSVATDAGAVADNWRRSRFEVGPFEAVDVGDGAWPRPADPTATILGRTAFEAVEAATGSAELLIDHTHGVRVWLNDVEVLTSNLAENDTVADAGPGPRQARVTVPVGVLQSGTNIVAVEMHRTANGDPPELEATLTANSAQVKPVSPLAPNDRAHRQDADVVATLAPTAVAPGRLPDVFESVIDDLERTNDDETSALRALVVIAPGTAPIPVETQGRADAMILWVGAGSDPPTGVDAAIDEAAGSAQVAATVAARLEAVAAGRLVLGICGPGTGLEAEVEVGVVNLTTTLRDPPPEDGPGPACDAPDAAGHEPDTVDDVELVLDDASRAVWNQRVGDNDKDPFVAAVDLGNGWAPIPAELSLRGQSSLECERKSYAVNLDGGDRRHIQAGAAFDEFFLLSMCLDEGFVRTHTMLDVLADHGLFPPAFRMVRFTIDGQPQGAYLLVEPPDEALRDAQPQLMGVVRRALDTSFQESTVAWSALGRDDVVLDTYERTIDVAEGGGGDMLERLAAELDLDRYLRWLALMSLTDNGDYVDEVFFAGVGVGGDDTVSPFWTPMGWDPDDIFSPCHFEDFQFVDPSGLSTCAEARIDQALLGTDAGYQAYVDSMVEALSSLTPEVFDAALARTRARLGQLVDDPAAAAMPEIAARTSLDTTTAAGFGAAVDAEVAALATAFAERHDFLVDAAGAAAAGGSPASASARIEAMVPDRVLAGQRYPMLVTAQGSEGVDRSRSDEVTVRVGDDEGRLLLHHGVAVATQIAGVGPATITLDGQEVPGPAVASEPDRAAAGRLDDDQRWGPDELVLVDQSLTIGPDATLTIEPGTTVVAGPGVNVDVEGSLVAAGTAEAPVLWADQDPEVPWGGIAVRGGSLRMEHVMATGGGGDVGRAFGHSESQPLIGAQDGAEVQVHDSVLADSAAKAFGIDGSRLDLTGTVVTRTDTGGELLGSAFRVEDSWFLDFPTIDAAPADDDNDALYLGPTTEPSTITDTVFVAGLDDGIDHAGADVTLERVWVEGFAHECVATSEGGSLRIVDSVLAGCEHGLEVGYGTPVVAAEHVLFLANGVALRYGDEYFVPSAGTLAVSHALLVDNVSGLALDAEPARVAIADSVSDDAGDVIAGVTVGSPVLDERFVWNDGDAGLESGWP